MLYLPAPQYRLAQALSATSSIIALTDFDPADRAAGFEVSALGLK